MHPDLLAQREQPSKQTQDERIEILERTVKYYAEREAVRNRKPEFDWRQPNPYYY